MYQVHDWAEVHRLFYREGWSKADIAEKLGMSRNTVTRLLGLKEPPSYERRPAGSKLDPHRGSIAKMLGADAKVAAPVILERLRRDGYDGGITILKDYLAEVRPLFVEAQSYQRTSYLPGEIGQTDWWEPGIRVPVGKGASREVFGLVTTLPHSAAMPPSSASPSRCSTSCRRSRGRFPASVECRRRWWWIGIPRSWFPVRFLPGSIPRWQPCSGRCAPKG